MKNLTPRQKDILAKLASDKELTWAKGGGWWLNLERVGGKTVAALLRGCALRESYNENDKYLIYEINETGRKALETGELMEYHDIVAMKNR
jgi:hypothetical protein